jgi:GTP-binding protein HflX
LDLLPPGQQDNLRAQGLLLISARTGAGIADLLNRIDAALVTDPIVRQEFIVPQDEGAVLAALEGGTVLHQRSFEGNNVHLSLAGPTSLLSRYRRFRVSADAGTGRNSGSGATSQIRDPSDPDPGLGNT